MDEMAPDRESVGCSDGAFVVLLKVSQQDSLCTGADWGPQFLTAWQKLLAGCQHFLAGCQNMLAACQSKLVEVAE